MRSSAPATAVKALDSRIHALGALPQPAAAQIRSSRICRGELTADYKLLPCSLPYGPTAGRSKWLQTILWRAANPDKNAGEHFYTATAARWANTREGVSELITGENSAAALLEKIKVETGNSRSIRKRRAPKVNL